MTRLLLTIILILFSVTVFAQTKPIRGNQFELTGKIINEISLTPHCGYVAWGTVIEFKILKFSNTKYIADTIAVIFTCPEFYKAGFFKVGQIYKVAIADENQADFGWTIPNEALLQKYNMEKRLWVISAENLN